MMGISNPARRAQPNTSRGDHHWWDLDAVRCEYSDKKSDKLLLITIKGRVHCFSMQVVMNKCFLLFLNPKKSLAQIRLVVFEKNAKNAHFNSKKLRHRTEG